MGGFHFSCPKGVANFAGFSKGFTTENTEITENHLKKLRAVRASAVGPSFVTFVSFVFKRGLSAQSAPQTPAQIPEPIRYNRLL